jgi:hypothetical protein
MMRHQSQLRYNVLYRMSSNEKETVFGANHGWTSRLSSIEVKRPAIVSREKYGSGHNLS